MRSRECANPHSIAHSFCLKRTHCHRSQGYRYMKNVIIMIELQCVQEWLVMFLANWHQNNNRDKDNGTPHHPSTSSHIDATLVAAPRSLQALVPATYALLRSAPLSPLVGASHSDRTQALCSLWTSLAPPELMRSIYPLFVTTENLHEVRLPNIVLYCSVEQCIVLVGYLQLCKITCSTHQLQHEHPCVCHH